MKGAGTWAALLPTLLPYLSKSTWLYYTRPSPYVVMWDHIMATRCPKQDVYVNNRQVVYTAWKHWAKRRFPPQVQQ